MAAASIRSRARWPPPAARRFSSPRWTKRAPRAPPRRRPRIYVLDGFFQNCGDAYAKIDCQARDRRSQRTRRMGRVLPPLRLGRRRRHPHRHRHEPARPDARGGAGHRSPDQCRRSRHHAGDEPPRLRRDASIIRSTPNSSRPSARSRACSPACRPRCRIRPAFSSGAQFQFDLVRPGAALYGVNPTPEADNPMQPVVDLKARIVQIRNVEKRRKRRLWRHLDRAAADQARDRLGRLCRRLFPRRRQQ